MIVLPLNSVINPLIYDNTIKDAVLNLLRGTPILNSNTRSSVSRVTKVETMRSVTLKSVAAKPHKSCSEDSTDSKPVNGNGRLEDACNHYQENHVSQPETSDIKHVTTNC